MRKRLSPLVILAVTTAALNVSALATITERPAATLQLSNGDDSQCQDYRIGSYASGEEIAAFLRDAAKGARVSGCVNLMIERER